MLADPLPCSDLSLMCCFCWGVSSGWGAAGTSIRRLFLRRNCSKRKAEGSSPHGEPSKRLLDPMAAKLFGRTPPSLAGNDKAILCFASSILFLICMMLVSGSFGVPNSSKKLGIFSMPSPAGLCGNWKGLFGATLFTFCKTDGDLRPCTGDCDDCGAWFEFCEIAIGMCFTGIGMLSSVFAVCMCRGDVFAVRFCIPATGLEGVWGEAAVCTCRGEEGEGFGALLPNIDCIGACMSDDCKKPTATRFVLSDWLNMDVGERGEVCGSDGGDGDAMLVIMGERKGEEVFLKLRGDVGDGLLTGEDDPLGDPSRRRIVDEIVFLAACFARSVLTKLDTRSSRFPFRFGEASNSRGVTSGAALGLCEM